MIRCLQEKQRNMINELQIIFTIYFLNVQTFRNPIVLIFYTCYEMYELLVIFLSTILAVNGTRERSKKDDEWSLIMTIPWQDKT